MLYGVARGLIRGIFKVLYRYEGVYLENVPNHGPTIICCNHKSNFDPLLLGIPLQRRIHYMAKAELFKVPVLGWIIRQLGAFPIKRGGVSKESLKLAVQLLKDEHMLGIFPEGSRSNEGGMGKKGAALLALKSGSAVVPAAVIGNYKLFRKMRVVYGRPIDLSEFADRGSEGLELATERIMQEIRGLIAAHGK